MVKYVKNKKYEDIHMIPCCFTMIYHDNIAKYIMVSMMTIVKWTIAQIIIIFLAIIMVNSILSCFIMIFQMYQHDTMVNLWK